MEVYILDSLLRRTLVVDRFESLIWTERFSAWGDFELHIQSTLENRNRLKPGVRLSINDSTRVMAVETTEDTLDQEGKTILKVKGRSLEAILENRLAWDALTDLTANPKWDITDVPAAIARKLFHDICVTGILNAGDVIPGIIESSIYPADTIGEPTTVVTYSIDPMTLYKAIKDICDAYGMGFRITRDPAVYALHWDVYMGSDRTSAQTTLSAVIFSPDLDNLQNTTLLTSNAVYKNVAYVFSPVGHEVVYQTDVPTDVDGFDRNVLIVRADDITDTTPSVASAKMIQRGKEELAKNKPIQVFDGELTPSTGYKYGVHYNLGDLVELRADDGTTQNMQVTEQIFASDSNGDRTYPTLTVNTFITPGSWLAWDFNKVWFDYDASPMAWEDAP
jgi:ReqiPepy6 Gp37-like protein